MMTDLSAPAAGLTKDDWMSRVLERDVYRYDPKAPPGKPFIQGPFPRPLFVYSKVPVEDVERAGWLQDAGFRLVDTNVVFERAADPPLEPIGPAQIRFADGPAQVRFADGPAQIRFADGEDEGAVTELARRSFVYSRFHLDPEIPRALADRIKAEWVANYWRGGRGTHMVVATVQAQAAGFLQLLHAKDGTLTIDLVAVGPDHRRMGVARDMIAFAIREIRPLARVVVGTQVANTPSVRLYENLGFRLKSAQYVFHLHATPSS